MSLNRGTHYDFIRSPPLSLSLCMWLRVKFTSILENRLIDASVRTRARSWFGRDNEQSGSDSAKKKCEENWFCVKKSTQRWQKAMSFRFVGMKVPSSFWMAFFPPIFPPDHKLFCIFAHCPFTVFVIFFTCLCVVAVCVLVCRFECGSLRLPKCTVSVHAKIEVERIERGRWESPAKRFLTHLHLWRRRTVSALCEWLSGGRVSIDPLDDDRLLTVIVCLCGCGWICDSLFELRINANLFFSFRSLCCSCSHAALLRVARFCSFLFFAEMKSVTVTLVDIGNRSIRRKRRRFRNVEERRRSLYHNTIRNFQRIWYRPVRDSYSCTENKIKTKCHSLRRRCVFGFGFWARMCERAIVSPRTSNYTNQKC